MRTPCLLLALLLPSVTVLGENLLTNPGFDRDLSGWNFSFSPDPPSPTAGAASLAWTSVGAPGSPGAVELRARSVESSVRAAAGQCFAVRPGSLATLEAKFLVRSQRMVARASVELTSFASGDCSGGAQAMTRADSLPFRAPSIDSGGEWLPARLVALVPLEARSVKAEVSATASTTRMYGSAEIDAVADDVVLTLDEVATTTWILPSSAWGSGTSESRWATFLTLANPTSLDANVTLKWLGHDVDGRGGIVKNLVVPGGRTVSPDLEEWELNLRGNWGAILITSTVKELVVQGETSTGLSGGSVGQVVPAFGPADCAGATPMALAPIRESGGWRTNLVLANPTEGPITARVVLFDAAGSLIGTRDVELPPLGMTQINSVTIALGASTPYLGRIAVSTSTPGGRVAAYASLIDNETNDPRTVLPR